MFRQYVERFGQVYPGDEGCRIIRVKVNNMRYGIVVSVIKHLLTSITQKYVHVDESVEAKKVMSMARIYGKPNLI